MFKAIVRLFRMMIGHRPDLEENPEKLEEYRAAQEHRKQADRGSVDRAIAEIRVRRGGGRFF